LRCRRAPGHPARIVPFERPICDDDRCVCGPHFRCTRNRVGLERQQVPVRIMQLELIARAVGNAGHEQFPHAAFAPQVHRMTATVPIVKIADNAHAAGIGGPHRKRDARNALMRQWIGAEDLGEFTMRALGEQICIYFAQDRNVRRCLAYVSNLRASVGNASEYVG